MKKKIVIISSIVIVLVLIFFITHHANNSALQVNPNAGYSLLNSSDVSSVQHGTIEDVISFTGDLSPVNATILSAEVTAQVLAVKVAEGEFVKTNQVLAILDNTDTKEDVATKKSILAIKKVKFALDKQKLERQKDLFDQGFISRFAYDELQTNYQSSLEEINQAAAALKQAQKQLSDTIVKSPFAGYIYQKYIDAGQIATVNGKLFALASLDSMQIKAAISSEQINKIKLGEKVIFKVETSDQTYMGQVTRINPVAEVGTRSFMIYIDFNNRQYKLKAGQFVKGQVVLSELNNVDFIRTDTIRENDNGKYVLILNGNKIQMQAIRVLLTNQVLNLSAITGLKAGDTVLSNNVITIKPGDAAKLTN